MRAVIISVLAVVLISVIPVAAEYYKYIDKNGTVVFTDDLSKVPEDQRSKVQQSKGTLGSEADIAIAVGMKDLMEPTHHVFWNLTDMFSLLVDGTYHLYTAEQIRADSTLSALASGAYIDPYPVNFQIGYMTSQQANPVYTSARVENLPEGRYIRLIVLVDRANNYLRETFSSERDLPKSEDFIFEGVTNQELNGIWQIPTPVNTFRYGLKPDGITIIPVIQHFNMGALSCKPTAINPITGEDYCPYPEEEAIPADPTPYPATINFP